MATIRFNRDKNEFEGIDKATFAKMCLWYPGVNVRDELRKMGLWLMTKGTTHKGTLTFITNWLSKAPVDNKLADEQEKIANTEAWAGINPDHEGYLENLWKPFEDLFQRNQLS